MKLRNICLRVAPIILIGMISGCKSVIRNGTEEHEPDRLRVQNPMHYVVFHEKGKFAAWPANNGIWSWEKEEVLAGLTVGPFVEKSGHNLEEPYVSLLSRSMDGGQTWESFDPHGYVGDESEYQDLDQPLNFMQQGFALRITGIGYHGNNSPQGAFFYSTDRGTNWKGPHTFRGFETIPGIDTLELSPRTDYILNSDGSCLVFISARIPGVFGSDRIFCAKTEDGGITFELQGWVVDFKDPYRAVMSSSVRCSDKKLVSSVRRREIGTERCWIDVFESDDNGLSWRWLSKVGDTGKENGNPPALLRMDDGRLVCAYGQRDDRMIMARISKNNGRTWGPEIILRDDYKADGFDNADLGYPRMVLREDGMILTLYYWATEERYEQHIACTLWDPDKVK